MQSINRRHDFGHLRLQILSLGTLPPPSLSLESPCSPIRVLLRSDRHLVLQLVIKYGKLKAKEHETFFDLNKKGDPKKGRKGMRNITAGSLKFDGNQREIEGEP